MNKGCSFSDILVFCVSVLAVVEPVFVDVLGGCHSFNDMVINYILKYNVV